MILYIRLFLDTFSWLNHQKFITKRFCYPESKQISPKKHFPYEILNAKKCFIYRMQRLLEAYVSKTSKTVVTVRPTKNAHSAQLVTQNICPSQLSQEGKDYSNSDEQIYNTETPHRISAFFNSSQRKTKEFPSILG